METRFLKGPGLYFVTHLGLFLDRLDPKEPTGGAFGRTMGGQAGQSWVGRRGHEKRVMEITANQITSSLKVI